MNKAQTSPEEIKTKKSPIQWARTAALLSVLSLILLVIIVGYTYIEFIKTKASFSNTITHLENRLANAENHSTMLEKSLDNLQASTQKAQELSKEQQQMIEEWNAAQKGNLEKWHLAEATHLLKLANDQLQFANDHKAALILMQQADQVMKSSQTSQTFALRKVLAENIASLQAAPDVDLTSLYLRLTALSKQINQLPLPETPLKADTNQMNKMPENLAWWRRGLDYSLNALRKVVIVRRIDAESAPPLVLPEEKNFLYQNLHAQIEQALWALLHRNPDIYTTSLERAAVWTRQFFDQTSPITQAVLQSIDALRKENIAPPGINFSKTVQLFDDHLKQINQPNQASPATTG